MLFLSRSKLYLTKSLCLGCTTFTRKIQGVDLVKDYLDIIEKRNSNKFNQIISVISLLAAIGALLISFITMIILYLQLLSG